MRKTTEIDLVPEQDCYEIDQIAKRVNTAQNKEELLSLLANVARQFDHDESLVHDESFMGGAAEGLLLSLHNALVLREGSKRKYYRTALSHSRALQCTVLITAIEMMFRCSSEVLAENVELLRKDLVLSLPKLLQLFLAWEGGETIRLLAISNAVKIIRRVGPICQEATDDFVEGLLCVLRAYIGNAEIHIEAANAIALLFDRQDNMAQRKHVIELIQKDSSLIISTLSTAAHAATSKAAEEVLTGLFNFSVNSHAFRTKMAKRRCTILAIGKHLSDDHVENRKVALNICKCLLNDHMQTTCEPARLDQNTELLLKKVMESALHEQETMLQLYAVSLLGDAVQNGNLLPDLVEPIMTTLRNLVDSDGQDDVIMEAAITFTKSATSMPPHYISREVLMDVADFTTLPFARARRNAISAIDYFVAEDDNVASILFKETELIENFSLIISHGSDNDCSDAMNVVRHACENVQHHQVLCQSNSLLHSLVQLVTKEEVTNENAYVSGVEAILSLLSNNDNVRSFLPYPDLLPFLVSLANETTSDEELKQDLVSAIVRLSSAILG